MKTTTGLQLLADRAAWLRTEPAEERERVLTDAEYAARYWEAIEATTHWAGHVARRRLADLRRVVFKKRGRK